MRIEGPRGVGRTQEIARPKQANKASSTNFADHVSTTVQVGAPTEITPVLAVDQLVGLQEVTGDAAGRKQGLRHANEVLDQLDMLRLHILEGRIPKDQLMKLAQHVNARRATTNDPQLLGILDEIDLRAQVEIAKFTRDIANNA